MTRSRLVIAFMISSLAFARVAAADESNAAAAQTLFKEGRAFIEKGRFAEACERLVRSDKIEPAVGTRLSLGECNEGLGHIASAWAAYNDATALATQRSDPRAAIAKKRADALEPKLARLTLRMSAPSAPDLLVIKNGVRVDPAGFDTALPVDAGVQTIEVSAPGKKPWKTSMEIHDAEAKEIRIPVLENDPNAASTTPGGTIDPSSVSSDSRRTLALGLEIGGGVALLGGLIVGGVAMSKWSSIEDTCPDAHCATNADRDRLQPDVSTARTLALVSTVAVVLGATAVVAGVALQVTAGPRNLAVAIRF